MNQWLPVWGRSLCRGWYYLQSCWSHHLWLHHFHLLQCENADIVGRGFTECLPISFKGYVVNGLIVVPFIVVAVTLRRRGVRGVRGSPWATLRERTWLYKSASRCCHRIRSLSKFCSCNTTRKKINYTSLTHVNLAACIYALLYLPPASVSCPHPFSLLSVAGFLCAGLQCLVLGHKAVFQGVPGCYHSYCFLAAGLQLSLYDIISQ